MLFYALALILAAPGWLLAAEMAGYTSGSFGVDDNGGAGYTIPIQAPPGFGAMTPSLSLSYNSQGGDGMLGMGWSLTGLSAITRGPATIGQDGYLHTVDYGAEDRFYLNGVRLSLMSGGVYGAPGTVYRTEFDDFTRIYFDGDQFIANTKDGQIIHFSTYINAQGTVPEDKIRRAWVIKDRYDRLGNRIHYEYVQNSATGEYRPVFISYKYIGNFAVNEIRFDYEDKPQPSQSYIGGYLVSNSQLLTHIITKVNGTTVRDYALVYDLSYSGRSRLRSITEYDRYGNNLKPTTFDWQSSSGNFNRVGVQSLGGGVPVYQTLAADFDGDGLTDITVLEEGAAAGSLRARVCTGNTDGTFTDHGVVIASQFGKGDIFRAGDFDGDGSRDILEIVVKDTSQKGNLYAYHSWGSYFQTNNPNPSGTGHTQDAPVYVADFNGDGRDDVLEFVDGHPYVWLAVDCQYLGGAFSAKTYWGTGDTITMPSSSNETVWLADINGDGMADVIAKNGNGWLVWLSTGNGFRKVSWSAGYGTPASTSILRAGDFNGDGKADVVEIANGRLTVWAASGAKDTAFAAYQNWLTSTVSGDKADKFAVGDFNSDGRDDLTDYAGRVFVSTGTGFTYLGQWGNWEGYQGQCLVGDLSGKGNRDVIWVNLVYVSVFSARAQADLMTGITNGIGNRVNITYKSINSGDPYFYSGSSGYSYPTRMPYRGPMYVVQEVSRGNGVNGGFNRYLYTYEGAKIDILRRRSLGFESIRMRDLQSRTDLVTFYKTAFPYTGLVSQQQTIHYPTDAYTQGTVVRDVNYGYECEIYRSSQPLQREIMDIFYKYWQDAARSTSTYAPRLKRIATDVYDVDSGKKTLYTYTGTTYDPLGLIKTKEERSTAYANDADNTQTTYSLNTIYTYLPVDQANWDAWNFGLIYETATSATNASGMLTRKTRYTYDIPRRLLWTEEREPDSGDRSIHLLTNYDYDGFGNVTAVSSIGWDGQVDNATRTTTYQHDYPQSSSNGIAAYSHMVTMRKRVNAAVELVETKIYNPYFGGLDQVIDPNGLVTSFSHDGFGRPTGEYRPDGTQTIKSYSLFPKGYYTGTVSSGKPNVVTFFDELDREIASATIGFDATRNIVSHITYNTLGLVETYSRPFYQGETELVTRYTYNDVGRLQDKTAYDAGLTHYDYNQSDGMSTWVTNAKSQVTKTKIDAQGKVVLVKQQGDDIATTYAYDPFGNLLTVTDSKNKTTAMTYDILGRKLTQSDPDMGGWTYTYNAFGELITQTDAKGQTIAMEYDALGRLTHRAVYTGTVNGLLRFFGFSGTPDEETWRDYDTAPMGATPGKQALGLPAAVRGMNGYIKSFAYDGIGRVRTVASLINNISYQVDSEYDQYGRIAAITYPNTGVGGYTPVKVRYGYTALGYLERVYDDADPAKVYWRAAKMDDVERVTEEVFGEGFTTQLTRKHEFFSDTARLQNIYTTKGSTTFQNLSYTYDALGNVLTRREAANPAKVLAETFEYDALNRLTQSELNDFWKTKTNYTYADNGNITYKTGVGLCYYTGDQPHAVTAAGSLKYGYDENGNMFEEYKKPLFGVKTVQRAFEYNADNMPVRVSKGTALATMAYDPDNGLITEDITAVGVTTSTVKIGDLYEKVTTGNVTEHRHYIAAGGGLVAIRTIRKEANMNPTDDTYWVLDDHLGSISAIVKDATGLADNKMSYTPHGERRNPDTWKGDPTAVTLITRRGFTGHVQLDAVGLIHMKGRCYDPMLGRFITPDPFVQAPYDSQSLNRYSYCLNNPLNYVDPSGFWSWRKFCHSILRGVAFAVGFLMGCGDPIAGCIIGSALQGAVAGYIDGGPKGMIRGAFMGGAAGMIGGTVSVAVVGIPYAPMVLTAAQIGYSYHREGWDALGYMAGGMIGQGMVMGANYAYNMWQSSSAKDTTGSIDGQKASAEYDENNWATQALRRVLQDRRNEEESMAWAADKTCGLGSAGWLAKSALINTGGYGSLIGAIGGSAIGAGLGILTVNPYIGYIGAFVGSQIGGAIGGCFDTQQMASDFIEQGYLYDWYNKHYEQTWKDLGYRKP